ncbi:MAG: hypothetical protein FWF84_03165, partial [Kiritimatiellaeota bacterium]|nr:hypothetical protein [Kiritimatiellota bacterium]
MKKRMAMVVAGTVVAALPLPAVAATATFAGADKVTMGAWYDYDFDSLTYEYAYGRTGYLIANNGAGIPLIPPGFGISVADAQIYSGSGAQELFVVHPTLPQRVSGIWFKGNSSAPQLAPDQFSVRVVAPTLSRVALYAYGYDGATPIWNIDVTDNDTPAPLGTVTEPYGTAGCYMVWLVQGDVTFTLSALDPSLDGTFRRPFLMAVFLDPPLPSFKDEGIANVQEDDGLWSAEICARLLSPADATTEVVICWGTSDEGTVFANWDERVPVGASFPETMSLPLDNLLASEEYYYNIMVSNAYGIAWAYEGDCPQIALGKPLATTAAADRIGAFSARLNGALNSFAPAEVDFLWWEDASSVTNVIALGVQESGTLEALADGLAAQTLYHFQVRAENEYGIALSEPESFSTVAVAGGTFVTAKAGVWHDPEAWDPVGVPTDGADVTVNHALSLTWPTFSLNSLSLNATVTVTRQDAALKAKDMTVASTVTHWPQSAMTANGNNEWVADQRVWIVCSNLTVASAGWINVNEKGYGKLCGPGHVPYSGAVHGYCSAGHGGRGNGGINSVTYGDAYAPVEPGSGGSNTSGSTAGSGGGVIRIEATGAVTVDGTVTANGGLGTYNWSPMGSGGSVYIDCETIDGEGAIRANGAGWYNASGTFGGRYEYDAAGGGRVAVLYNTAAQAQRPVPGLTLSASGGVNEEANGSRNFRNVDVRGEPGTVYVPDFSFFPKDDLKEGDGFVLIPQENVAPWSPSSFTMTNTWVILPEGHSMDAASMDIAGISWLSLSGNIDVTCDTLSIASNGLLRLAAGATNGIAPEYGARLAVRDTLTIGGTLRVASDPHNGGSVKITAKNVAMAPGSVIDADGLGFAGGWLDAGGGDEQFGFGPGRPLANPMSSPGNSAVAASHGGRGGYILSQTIISDTTSTTSYCPTAPDSVAPPYGDAKRPLLPGSGSARREIHAGDTGGGAIWVRGG